MKQHTTHITATWLQSILRTAWTAVLFTVCLTAAKAQQHKPEFVRIVDETFQPEDMVIADSVFFEDSEALIFIVNKWDMNLNSPLIQRIEREVLPLAAREGWRLAGVRVRGTASPEGPLRWNIELSQRRANTLTEYLRRHFLLDPKVDPIKGWGKGAPTVRQQTGQDLSIQTTAEDYVFLYMMMRDRNDADAERVGEIIRKYNGDMVPIKRDMMRLDQGRLWKRLLRDYYPTLRAARVMLFFRKGKPAFEEVEMTVPTAEIAGLAEPIDLNLLPIDDLLRLARRPREHMLAVRTNLLYDFFYYPDYGFAPSPDVQMEFYPRRSNFTLVAGLTCPYWHRWDRNQFWQFRHYTLGARYYFTPQNGKRLSKLPLTHRTHNGWFVGADVMNTIYGIGLSKRRGWEGEGLGAEVTGGYVVPLSRDNRWRMEFVVGLGTWYTRFDPYVYGNPKDDYAEDGLYYYKYTGKNSDFRRRNHQLWWFGPTQVGVNITVDIAKWKNK